MDSFEDLGVSEPLVEALAAEGVERPTSLQEKSLPVLNRGHDLVLRSGPGAGIAVAYGAPLLDRIDPDGPSHQALVLVPDEDRARGVAESLGSLALTLGHQVSAFAPGWADVDQAEVVVGTPTTLGAALGTGTLDPSGIKTLVLDGLSIMLGGGMGDTLTAILSAVPPDAQRVAVSLPVSDEAQAFVDRHLRRATHVPPRVTDDGGEAVRRGMVEFSMIRTDRVAETLDHVSRLLKEGIRHVLVFCRTEDGAADLGDLLDLRGFRSGYPGDPDATVWLGVDDMEGRRAIRELESPDQVATISMDVPSDPDALDRRHGLGVSGLIMVLPREIPHLREVAREAGHGLRSPLAGLQAPSERETDGPRLPIELFESLRKGSSELATPEVAQLLGQYSAEAVAVAAVSLLLSRGLADPVVEESSDEALGIPKGVPRWVKVFLTVGEKDEVTTGDLLGAITGEAGVEGEHVGRIEIKDNYSRVEIREDMAPKVVKAINGTSIRGRSVRADYDRGSARSQSGRGPSKGGPAKGPPRRKLRRPD